MSRCCGPTVCETPVPGLLLDRLPGALDMTEELDVQPELHLPTNATGSTHMFTRAKLQDHFAAWQGNIQAAVRLSVISASQP